MLPNDVELPKLTTYSRKFAYYLACLVIIIALAVLAGWAFDISFFKRPLPGLVAMNPITAISFVLTGAALLCFIAPANKKSVITIGIAATLVAFFLGLIKILQVVTKTTLINIDALFWADRLKGDLVGNVSNSIAPNTAISFVLICVSLLLIVRNTKKTNTAALFIALFVFFTSLLVIVGYVYGINVFYNALLRFPMAVHTAANFLFLSFAILLSRSNVGFMRELTSKHVGGSLARTLLPAAIILPIVLGVGRIYIEKEGFVSSYFATALFALSNIIILVLLIWRNISTINLADKIRSEAESRLSEFNKELEETIVIRTGELYKSEKNLDALINNITDMV
jgi:hypothetical protein